MAKGLFDTEMRIVFAVSIVSIVLAELR